MKNWNELPQEIKDKMLDRMEQDRGIRKEEIFQEHGLFAGFVLQNTPEGHDFWNRICYGDFDLFFRKYPERYNIYYYELTTSVIWTSFDNGRVKATSLEQAREKALDELRYNLDKVNLALDTLDNTKGFSVEMNLDQLEVTEIN